MDDIIIYSEKEYEEILKLEKEIKNKEVIIALEKNDEKIREQLQNKKNKTGLIIKNLKEIKQNHKYDVLIGLAKRELIETKQIKYLYGAENQERKDKTHYRQSGLNQVSAKIMKEKNKTYIFDLSQIINKNKNEQIKIIGRMKQNKKILQKYKVKMKVASFAKTPLNIRAQKEMKLFLTEI